MNTHRHLVAFFLPLVLTATAAAETPFERELTQLKTERRAALDAAARVIDGYQQKALTELMKRAGAAGDVDTAVKAKDALGTLPSEVAKALVGEWDLLTTTHYSDVLTFKPDGTGHNSGGSPFTWSIIGHTLTLGDPDTADTYSLPVKDGRLIGHNRIGNGITLTKRAEVVRRPEPKPVDAKPALPETKEEFQTYLIDTSWAPLGDRSDVRTFRRSGIFEGREMKPSFKVTGRRAVTITWTPQTIIPCVFAEDLEVMVEQSGLQQTFVRAKQNPPAKLDGAEIKVNNIDSRTTRSGIGQG